MLHVFPFGFSVAVLRIWLGSFFNCISQWSVFCRISYRRMFPRIYSRSVFPSEIYVAGYIAGVWEMCVANGGGHGQCQCTTQAKKTTKKEKLTLLHIFEPSCWIYPWRLCRPSVPSWALPEDHKKNWPMIGNCTGNFANLCTYIQIKIKLKTTT